MSNVKRTVALAEHVYRLAQRRAKLVHGDNISSYINSLICKDFSEAELDRELNEISKPVFSGKTKTADFPSTCKHCYEMIKQREVILLARFEDGNEDWVHKDCCRKE